MSPIMRKLFPFILLLIGFISLQRHELYSQTNTLRTLSIQGMLTSSFGSKPITGKQVFRVGIYESSLGGFPLHEQIDTVLVGETGLYQFSLGGMTGLPRTVKFDKPYFIDISVNGEKQNMRIPLQSAAYAFMAGAVENEAIGLEQLSPVIREKIFPDDKKNGEKAFANYPSGFRTIIAGGDENRTSANYSSILGGFTNTVSGTYGTVAGGQGNQVIGAWSFVGGGANNRALGSYTTVTAGSNNTVTSSASNGTVSGGRGNQVGAINATVSGGSSNTSSGASSVVGGGASNKALHDFATVAGGSNNNANASGAAIVGGESNTTSGKNAFVGGGNSNTASGMSSSVSSGENNTVTGSHSVITGGLNNKITGLSSTISGGTNNTSSSNHSTISGGLTNNNSADFGTVSGGGSNILTKNGTYATIAGGQKNSVAGSYSVVTGGLNNQIIGFSSIISGGTNNNSSSNHSTISGGRTNSISADFGTVSGGESNSVTNNGMYATIAGGQNNVIHGRLSGIGSGSNNSISQNSLRSYIASGDSNVITHTIATNNSNNSVIVGGSKNTISNSTYSAIVGGSTNIINGSTSFVGGGQTNSITGNHGTIGGGQNNSITSNAQWSTIAGGRNNIVSADYSTASGNSNTIGSGASDGIALGSSNQISPNATFGVAVGNVNRVTGTQGVAIGYNNIADANAIAIGSGSTAAVNAMALGNGSTAAANQLYSKFTGGHVFEGQGTAIGNYVAQFNNPTAGGNGIEIKIANPVPSISNYFVNFKNASGRSVGRITGQTLAEMHASKSYKDEKLRLEKERDSKAQMAVFYGLAMINKTQKVVKSGIEVFAAPAQIAAATASTAATVGAGAGWTANTIADKAFKVAEAIGNGADALVGGYQVVQATVESVLAKEKLKHWIIKRDADSGVTYESGAADYAEWLPKQETTIDFAESDIVGIHQGKIRYETDGAEQLMVVSSRPMILGNMPAYGKEHDFEAVAFMGQVPVSVLGAVKKGDFILPSGGNHGLGIAVHPEDMQNEDFGNIVGIAWSDAPDTFAINKVNVAVGLQTTTLANQIYKQSKEIAELNKAVRMIRETLIAMSGNQSKAASISDKLDNIFSLANDQSSIDSKPSLDGEKKISVHAMHKECLLKFDTMISNNDIPALQKNNNIQSSLVDDPILKELYIYSMIQKLRN